MQQETEKSYLKIKFRGKIQIPGGTLILHCMLYVRTAGYCICIILEPSGICVHGKTNKIQIIIKYSDNKTEI